MAKFHITKSGATAPCTASVKQCPLGGEEAHYDSVADAARASATRAIEASTVRAAEPEAVPVEQSATEGLKAFYIENGRNYVTGATGVFAAHEASDWLVTHEHPSIAGAAEGWVVELDVEARDENHRLLSGVFDRNRKDSLLMWRESDLWKRVAARFPKTFAQLEKDIDDAHYNRDLL